MNTMYSENVYFPDVFKGCNHECVYCKPSFQRQAKRQRQTCKVLNEKGIPKCYTFEPHLHEERLKRKSPVTQGKQFVFFPKGGDLAFATEREVKSVLNFMFRNPQTTFLSQTKNPQFWLKYAAWEFPKNLIIGLTLETDKNKYNTESKYKEYREISKAPFMLRFLMFECVDHNRKAIIVEPILPFSQKFASTIGSINPEFVYVGYDTKKCKLPEPTLAETEALIETLRKEGLDVRLKTIRNAWYEPTTITNENNPKGEPTK